MAGLRLNINRQKPITRAPPDARITQSPTQYSQGVRNIANRLSNRYPVPTILNQSDPFLARSRDQHITSLDLAKGGRALPRPGAMPNYIAIRSNVLLRKRG